MKEEILRAIKWLEPSKGNYDDWLYSHVWMSGRAFYDIIQTSLVALQEQLDRLEGADRVQAGVGITRRIVCSKCEKQVYREEKYCKNCGRKLRGGEDE